MGSHSQFPNRNKTADLRRGNLDIRVVIGRYSGGAGLGGQGDRVASGVLVKLSVYAVSSCAFVRGIDW